MASYDRLLAPRVSGEVPFRDASWPPGFHVEQGPRWGPGRVHGAGFNPGPTGRGHRSRVPRLGAGPPVSGRVRPRRPSRSPPVTFHVERGWARGRKDEGSPATGGPCLAALLTFHVEQPGVPTGTPSHSRRSPGRPVRGGSAHVPRGTSVGANTASLSSRWRLANHRLGQCLAARHVPRGTAPRAITRLFAFTARPHQPSVGSPSRLRARSTWNSP